MARVDFGDWYPDLPRNNNPGAVLVKNCIPRAKSYSEIRDLVAFSDSMDDACLGHFWARADNGTVFNFFGDADKLYRLVGGTTMTDVSQAATTYSADFWDFLQFKDRVIATDGGGTAPQYFDMGTSTEFDDLPDNPPLFKTMAVIRNFVVGGNWTFGGDTERGGLAWSGFNNSGIWTPSLATQSDRIPSRGAGGQVQRIVPGAIGIVMRENSVLTLEYVGPPQVFKPSELITAHGTPAPRSVCWTKDYAFYYSTDGFFQLDRRQFTLTPIGTGKVDRFFRESAAVDDLVNVISTVDRTRNLVVWAYRTSSSSALYNRLLIYNWAFKRWAYAEIDTQWISEYAAVGANLDTLDDVLGSGGIDINSIPVDTDAYIGGGLSLMGMTSSNEAATFTGTALVAEIDTPELGVEGKRAFANTFRPIVDGNPSNIEIAPITRPRVQDSISLGTFMGVNGIGAVNFKVNSRYIALRCRITGGFSHAQGIEYDLKSRGKR